jgi:competence protein ComFB
MNVHNILEEVVIQKVNELYDKIKTLNTTWLTCDCEQCRIDTISYVLNRIPPRYIVSGRGITHQTAFQNPQTYADIETLIMEGMKTVASSKRSYHGKTNSPETIENVPSFNFPAFLGSVSDGETFEPIEGVKLTLFTEDGIATMMDHTWANPILTSLITKGRYSFWLKPIKAETIGQQKTFNFTIEANAPHYELANYSFSVPIVSSKMPELIYNATYSLQLQNFCLFPKEK